MLFHYHWPRQQENRADLFAVPAFLAVDLQVPLILEAGAFNLRHRPVMSFTDSTESVLRRWLIVMNQAKTPERRRHIVPCQSRILRDRERHP